MKSFWVALAFLTYLPIRYRTLPTANELARSRYWYPFVGILVGSLLGILSFGLARIAPPNVAAVLILLAWIGVTGALHLDGVADSCDGLFGGADREERLRIMRDPHIGAFGVIGLIVLLLGKFAALSELASSIPSREFGILIGVGVLMGRCSVLVMAGLSPYARPEGTGKFLIASARPWEAVLAVVVILGVTCFFQLWAGMIAVIAVLLATWVCRRRLGGATGDTLGLAVEVVEYTWMLTCAVFN